MFFLDTRAVLTLRGPSGLLLLVHLQFYELSCDFITVRHYAKRGVYAVVVCLCVCLCVCRYCIKTAKRRIMQITLHDSPRL